MAKLTDLENLTNFLVQLQEDLIILGNEQITKELTEYIKETCNEYGLCKSCFAEVVESQSSIDGDVTRSCVCSTRIIRTNPQIYKFGGVGK